MGFLVDDIFHVAPLQLILIANLLDRIWIDLQEAISEHIEDFLTKFFTMLVQNGLSSRRVKLADRHNGGHLLKEGTDLRKRG